MLVLRSCTTLVATLYCVSASSVFACDKVDALIDFASTKTKLTDATCKIFQSSSTHTGVSCHWEFAFRDQAATTFAQSLWSTLQACREGTEIDPDLRVNHPDSYYLREWDVGGDVYRVSVKDKGADNRTLVFFRYR